MIEVILFSGINFDDVNGGRCHKDLVPIIRRYALLTAEKEPGLMTVIAL